MLKKFGYVSGKYTSSSNDETEVDKNIDLAARASVELFKRGFNVYTPHKNFGTFERTDYAADLNYEFWMEVCLDMIYRVDFMFMLNNWESSGGAVREHNLAKEVGIPIFYEENGFPVPEDIETQNDKLLRTFDLKVKSLNLGKDDILIVKSDNIGDEQFRSLIMDLGVSFERIGKNNIVVATNKDITIDKMDKEQAKRLMNEILIKESEDERNRV